MISQIFHSNLKAIGLCKGCWNEVAIYSRREPEKEMSLKKDISRRKEGKKKSQLAQPNIDGRKARLGKSR